MEEINTEVSEVVTPEANADVTPTETETQVTPNTEETNANVEETQKTPEKKPIIEGLTYETPEDLVKGVKEKDATIAKISQELKELKEAQEKSKFEQTKTQVETGNVQLKQEYETVLTNINNWKRNARAEALANYQDTGDVTVYDYALQMIDAQFDQAKSTLDNNYRNVETQLTQQQKELLTLTQQRNLEAFKSENTEFCEKYQPVIDEYIKMGLDPQDLGIVKKLLNLALATETNKNELANANNEAKQKLVSSTSSGSGFTENHIFTRAEIAKMSPNQFTKYEKIIDKQMSQGLIT